jgi:two-component system CheB/CheR fusion protein
LAEENASAEGVGDGHPQPTPICAIGASAGGVQALRELFRHLPDDLGLAYVVIMHLAPDQR